MSLLVKMFFVSHNFGKCCLECFPFSFKRFKLSSKDIWKHFPSKLFLLLLLCVSIQSNLYDRAHYCSSITFKHTLLYVKFKLRFRSVDLERQKDERLTQGKVKFEIYNRESSSVSFSKQVTCFLIYLRARHCNIMLINNMHILLLLLIYMYINLNSYDVYHERPLIFM